MLSPTKLPDRFDAGAGLDQRAQTSARRNSNRQAGTIGHVILRSHAQLHSRGYDERQRNVQMAMRLAVVSDVALAVVLVCAPAPAA